MSRNGFFKRIFGYFTGFKFSDVTNFSFSYNGVNMIEFFWGLPSEGKTYIVVKRERDKMINGRIVFSNFPIIFNYKGKQFSSFFWKDKFVYETIHDCDIVIDEGYRTASSRDWKTFTVDEHTFYATTGHNGIDVFFITQAIPRVEVVIREIVSKFHQIKKTTIPWFRKDPRGEYEKILWFVDEVRLQSPKTPGTPADEIYTSSHSLFSKNVAKAYDTKYYRKPGEITFVPELWARKLNINPPEKSKSLIQKLFKNRKIKDIGLPEVQNKDTGEWITLVSTMKDPKKN